ncbi:MAG: FAD-binding oxidoreductase [Acidobacteria bacterium]|nr:FAD-binding oxidoreductase [Acidobacteriota bacterium]
MPTRHGRSPWIDQFPTSRVPAYSRQRGRLTTDVVIVGGGLTGCATAYAFAAAGVRVALVEAARVGQGNTALSAGWIADDPGVAFAELEAANGLRATRHAWQSWRRAALDFVALLRRLDVKCHLETRPIVTLARTPEQATQMARDRKARRNAGLDAVSLNARAIGNEVAVDAIAGLRSRDGATIDPYRACLGLAAAAVDRGAVLFERTTARRIRFGRKAVDVFTGGGAIRAGRVVIATGMPTPLFKALQRHFWFRTSYLVLSERVPAKTRQLLGRRAAVVRDMAAPPHVVHWVRWAGDERLLVSGADSEEAPPRRRDKIIVQRTGQLMYELSTLYPDVSGLQAAYGWAADYARTADGLPYIGPHRNYPRHLFAFGDSSHSVTGAYLASRILLRHYSEELDSADEPFGFARTL